MRYDGELERLLRLAQEGLYWQGDVEDLLVAIRDDGDLGELARAGGPIISRYERCASRCARSATRGCASYVARSTRCSPTTRCCCNCALDLLAVSWRSERLREEQARLGSVGRQGERLERLTAGLKQLAIDGTA